MMPLLVKTKRDHGHFGENDFMCSDPARRSLSNGLKQNNMLMCNLVALQKSVPFVFFNNNPGLNKERQIG